jgi:hypothetical protein
MVKNYYFVMPTNFSSLFLVAIKQSSCINIDTLYLIFPSFASDVSIEVLLRPVVRSKEAISLFIVIRVVAY